MQRIVINVSDYKECNLVYQQTIHHNINDNMIILKSMYIYLTEVVFRNIVINMYLIVLETNNQGTREHRCR